MKSVNEMWSAIRSSPASRGELARDASALGFRPAFLDCATMRVHPCPLPTQHGASARSLVAGFERGGFFYTPRAASRACQEWRLAD